MGGASAATVLLGSEADGLSIDLTDASLVVRDTTTSSNAYNGDVQAFWRDRSFTSYASPSPKITRGSDGLYGYRPHNLLVVSERFDSAAWNKGGTTAVSYGQSDPNGGSAASLVTQTAGDAHHVQQQATSATGQYYTASLYAKAGTLTWLRLSIYDSAHRQGFFDLSNGVVGTPDAGVTQSIESIGSGWYRCTVTILAAAANPYLSFYGTNADTGAATQDGTFTVFGAQLNAGPTATTYVKTAAHNLSLQSQTFDNASWSKDNCAATANSTVAPDGTTTGDTITADAGSSAKHAIQASFTVSAAAWTGSCYIKKGNYQYVAVSMVSFGTESAATAIVNLDAGTITQTTSSGGLSGHSSAITNVGNGWYRVSITGTFGGAYASTGIQIGFVTGATPTIDANGREITSLAGTETVILWGAQLELASSPGKYVTTTGSAVYETRYELPREWDANGACQGLLVEEARTNLCLGSSAVGGGGWTVSTVTVTADNTAAPDGNTTGARLAATGGDSFVNRTISVSESTAYTWSVWLKADSATSIDIYIVDGGGGSGNSSTTCSVTTSWQRFTLTRTTSAGTTTATCYVGGGSSFTTGETVYAWGAQLEAGASATSYIPTTSASVTRAKDDIRVSDRAAPSTATAGTMFVKFGQTPTVSAVYGLAALSDGTTNEAIGPRLNAADTPTFVVFDTGSLEANFSTANTITPGSTNKVAASWAVNDFAICANAGTVATDTTGTLPGAAVHTLLIGEDWSAGSTLCGYVKQILLLPRAMTDGQLQTVTT